MQSPLGPYAARVAALTAIGIIGAWLAATIFGKGIDPVALGQLQTAAMLAIGAVFGSAVTVNGYKGPLDAFGAKLDIHANQLSALAGVVAEAHPNAAPVVEAIVTAPTEPPA